ncbi:MAG TPA: sulfotransferase [Gammaproteobacteria bacterium]|nr:sulfotransferase [Gammaproteobacteria bacterium]
MVSAFSLRNPRSDIEALVEAFVGPRQARQSHRRLPADSGTLEKGLDVIRRRWPQLRSPASGAPVFILSAGWRSGSTFLQRAVMAASGILIWGEPYRRAALVESLSSQVRAFTDQWPYDSYFLNRFETSSLADQWVANLYPEVEALLAAHVAYFERLFKQTALDIGLREWGFKGVSLSVSHACYLRWLFPNAKFLFIYRNPYHAYRSYYQWRNWYRTWPAQPVFTPREFGSMWTDLAADFINHHQKVDGLLLRYEDLKTAATKRKLEEYLDRPIANPASLKRIGGKSDSMPSRQWAPRVHYFLLRQCVNPLAAQMGYRGP